MTQTPAEPDRAARPSNPTTGESALTVVIEPPRGLLHIPWRELWDFRDLWWMLSLQQIQVRYRQAVFGGLWALIQPVAAAAAFAVIFRGLVGETQGIPYFLFAYSGMLMWTMVASTVSEGSTSLLKNSLLLTKVYFPRLIMPLSTIGFVILDLVVGLLVLVVFMGWHRQVPGIGVLAVPFVLLGALVCALAVSVLLSALTVRYRDFRFVVPFGLQMWFFLSPVIYPVKVLGPGLQKIIMMNPMVGWLSAFRACLFGSDFDVMSLLVACGVTFLIAIAALVYFRQVEGTFSDIV